MLLNTLKLVVSQDGRDDSVRIQQDASIYATRLRDGGNVTHNSASGRHLYLQVASGGLELNGIPLSAGDGAIIEAETKVALKAKKQAEALLFDLP